MNKVYDLNKILPHNYPMILIDDLISVDMENRSVKASVHIDENKIFFDREIKGIDALVGIEYMAQCIGCYAYFRNGEQEPKIGFLLGTRSYEISIEKFELGQTYFIEAKEVFTDNELVSFECFIYNGDMECAKATINVYQPQDVSLISNM